MNENNESPFPSNANDPFNTSNLPQQADTTWMSEGQSSTVPRWQLLTDQEKDEQSKIINKLESKLRNLDKKKDKPLPNYTNQIIPDTTHSFHSSESEEEDGNGLTEDEVEEGLPLLWNSTSRNIDQAPRKTEDQYSKQAWWLSCFFCCK